MFQGTLLSTEVAAPETEKSVTLRSRLTAKETKTTDKMPKRKRRTDAELVLDMSVGKGDSEDEAQQARVTRRSRAGDSLYHSTPKRCKEPSASGSDTEDNQPARSPLHGRRRRKAFGRRLSGVLHCDGSLEGGLDLAAWCFSERRAVPKTDYNETTTHCPMPGCDSKGHLSGRHGSHRSLKFCPLFHNTSAEACKNRHDARRNSLPSRKNMIKLPNRRGFRRQGPRKMSRVRVVRGGRRQLVREVSDSNSVVEEEVGEMGMTCQSSTATELDKQLFRKAQARATQLLEEQITEPNQKVDLQEYRIKKIEIGRYEIMTWYSAPYPEEYARLPKIYLCEFCLKYMKTATILQRHMAKCAWRHPPGDEIYRKNKISVFEVDGKKNKVYCQNLCLLAKLFLDHKTLYFDVEPFLFYVMTDHDDAGCHVVGYFSKEKNSFLNYNVSCLLTLPQYMRRGFGKMLIDFSYLLSKQEGKVGSPERPLSELGLLSYRSYWREVVLGYLHRYKDSEVCIKDMSQETAINAIDLVGTLQELGMLKYWKGKHLVLKRQDLIDDYMEKEAAKSTVARSRVIDHSFLKWTPPSHRSPAS